jgi:alpha-1,6-mannosyltransferase
VGQAARRRAEDRHGWDSVFGTLCGIYGGLTGHPGFGTTKPLRASH